VPSRTDPAEPTTSQHGCPQPASLFSVALRSKEAATKPRFLITAQAATDVGTQVGLSDRHMP
jgi:hypothetical protein